MIELLFAFVCSNVSSSLPALPLALNASLFINLGNYTVYLYGISTGPPCLHMKAFLTALSKEYGVKVVWIPVDKVKPNVTEPLTVLEQAGLPLEVPISAVYEGKRLKAIVIGDVENTTFWLNLFKEKFNGTAIYVGQKLYAVWKGQRASPSPLPALALAFVDALNPIGLTVFVLYMALCRSSGGNCYARALEFVLAYASAHTALGLFLSSLPASPYYPIAGIIAALVMIYATVKPRQRLYSKLGKVSQALSRLALRRTSALLLGALAGTVGTSPCVLGAFLSAASVLSKLPLQERLLFWALYAAIYSLPPLLIAFVFKRFTMETRKLVFALANVSLVASVITLLYNLGVIR